jgi:peptide/nickel transport system substrate-binding protein
VPTPEDPSVPGISRRRFLIGSVGAAALGFLAACRPGARTADPPSPGVARRGGRIRVGVIGAGQSETLNPALLNSPIDGLRGYSVFDPLVRVGQGFTYEPGLALEWTPNSNASVWDVRLRPDVRWHDGKPLTADDLIYTLRSMDHSGHFGHGSVVNIRLRDLRRLDDLTVRIPLERPNAQLWDGFVYMNSAFVIQDGTTDFSKPVGTGPYSLESFTPGERSLAKRNPGYWEEGTPYADELEVISIDDADARLNALLADEIDVMQGVPGPVARAQGEREEIRVLEAASGPAQLIYMRVDVAPFDDVRVRRAMKLIADRQALIEGAFAGFGTVMNDLPGRGLPYYAEGLPQRQQDLEEARSLLRAAGAEDLRLTLQTSPAVPGMVEAATLFAEQAATAGVTIRVEREDPSTYFNPSLLYLKMPFAQDSWPTASLAQLYELLLLCEAPVNQTHACSEGLDELFWRARGETDEGRAEELWFEVQQRHWEDGGNIIWAARHSVDGVSRRVGGIRPGWVYPLGDFRVWDWWLAGPAR